MQREIWLLSTAFCSLWDVNFLYWWSLIIAKSGEPPNWLWHIALDYKLQQAHTQMPTHYKTNTLYWHIFCLCSFAMSEIITLCHVLRKREEERKSKKGRKTTQLALEWTPGLHIALLWLARWKIAQVWWQICPRADVVDLVYRCVQG